MPYHVTTYYVDDIQVWSDDTESYESAGCAKECPPISGMYEDIAALDSRLEFYDLPPLRHWDHDDENPGTYQHTRGEYSDGEAWDDEDTPADYLATYPIKVEWYDDPRPVIPEEL